MANLKCLPTQNITTQEADMRGSGDSIPANHFLRIDYAFAMGGPYTAIGTNNPGTNTVGQVVTQHVSGLSSTSTSGATYYYRVREIDTDGVTVLSESAECNFTTLPYNPHCEIITSDDTTITVRVCADYVNTDQQLQAVYSFTSGGAYTLIGGSVAGTYVVGQCQTFVVPVTPCDNVYFKARVTPVPAEYSVDWQYAHGNRSGSPETSQLRIGDQAQYPANQTLVNQDTVTLPATSVANWHLLSGTFPVPAGVSTLHMGFVSLGGGSIGNFIDNCSIVLNRVFPNPAVIGEQLHNPTFNYPALPPGGFGFFGDSTLDPSQDWSTSEPDHILEIWHSGFLGYTSYSDGGDQFAELNANLPSELFQVVPLDVGTADSVLECPAAVFNLECTMATPECLVATINGTYCGLSTDYWYAFQVATSPLGPWTDETPRRHVPSLSEPNVPISEALSSLEPNTTYYFRVVVYDSTQTDIIGISDPICNFTTSNCVFYCGMPFDPNDCILVDPGNGDPPYYYCFQF